MSWIGYVPKYEIMVPLSLSLDGQNIEAYTGERNLVDPILLGSM